MPFDYIEPKFPLGQTAITAAAHQALNLLDVQKSLSRHQRGDWGEVDEEDRYTNQQSLRYGARVMSVYRDRGGTTFWIITESDRSATTVLLPEDY